VSSSAVVGAASAAGLGVPEDLVGPGAAEELDESDGRPKADLAAGDGESVGGLRSELRRQIRAKRRLRVITLMSLSVVVLGLLPLIFGIRSASRDPVFNSLDALDVPGWAASQVKDQGSGSRWCFLDCRFRERTAQSSKPYADTAKVYSAALTTAGWQRWQVGQCPDQPVTQGSYTCWKRDEFTLDLWVGPPECAVDQVAAQDPAALPSSGVVPTTPASKCVGSTVSIKVQNAITDLRGRTDPRPNPSLVGETPDPTLAPDPSLSPTPTQS
jgi:integrin beta 3